MRYLGLDIGERRTGCAITDDATRVPVALDSIRHSSMEELLAVVLDMVRTRHIDTVVLGMPFLPSGEKGAQAAVVEDFADLLENEGVSPVFVDERYTSPRQNGFDSDASAAVLLLTTFLDRSG